MESSLSSEYSFSNENLCEPELHPEANAHNEDDIIRSLISQLTGANPEHLTNSADTCPEVQHVTNEKNVKLQDPPNLDEILATQEDLITPTTHNVSVINAACQQILKQMEHQLMVLLKKNRKEQDVIQAFLNANCKNIYSESSKKISLKCAGIPYFKDTYGFQAPPNEDVLRKKRNDKLLPIDLIKGFSLWSSTDAKTLANAVKKSDSLKISEIDWMKISVTDMEGKFSPSECKAKWIMHINPRNNRSKWTLKERKLLKELSAKNNYQDWDKIASELGTNRTGLQCCVQYHTNSCPTEGKWTKEEDEKLQTLVDKFKVKDYIPWPKVVWHFESRSLKQCQERYAYHLGNIKKGTFTMEEDFIIVYLASKLKNFGEVAKFLPKRVATQVRSRYEYLVTLSMPNFSKEEDELLTKLMIKYPRNWRKISENFDNRSRIQCRKRWAHLQKKVELNDDIYKENDDDDDDDDDDADDDDDDDDNKEENKDDYMNSTADKNIDKSGALGTNQSTSARKIIRSAFNKSLLDAANIRKNIQLLSVPATSAKKCTKTYSKLLDYHKYCHKFLFGPKPRIPNNSEDLKNLSTKMILTMQTLSVPQIRCQNDFNMSTLTNNCEFDKEDLSVLKELTNKKLEVGDVTKKIIPPNYMTLVALRTFSIGWNQINNMWNFYQDMPHPSNSNHSEDRILCSDAKKLFKARLKTIFAFPMILSFISPTKEQKPVHKPKSKKVKPLSKGRRKKHAKYMSAVYRNKLKTLNELYPETDTHHVAVEFSGSKREKKIKVKSNSVKQSDEGSVDNINSLKKTRFASSEDEGCASTSPLRKKARQKNLDYRL